MNFERLDAFFDRFSWISCRNCENLKKYRGDVRRSLVDRAGLGHHLAKNVLEKDWLKTWEMRRNRCRFEEKHVSNVFFDSKLISIPTCCSISWGIISWNCCCSICISADILKSWRICFYVFELYFYLENGFGTCLLTIWSFLSVTCPNICLFPVKHFLISLRDEMYNFEWSSWCQNCRLSNWIII